MPGEAKTGLSRLPAAPAPATWQVRRHAAGLVAGEQLGRRAPTWLVLEVEIAERLLEVLYRVRKEKLV